MNSILSDVEIIRLAQLDGMITPFVREQRNKGIVSYGLSSFGYDIRLAGVFRVFTPQAGQTFVDPKNFTGVGFKTIAVSQEQAEQAVGGVAVEIPANSFMLGYSVERIKMPKNVTGLMTVKSTYARCGITCPSTVLEAGWEGFITIEIANLSPVPAFVYPFEGISQILFFRGNNPALSYADRRGKYQNQGAGITYPKVNK